MTVVNNRISYLDNIIQETAFRNDQYEVLRSDAFEKMIGRRISPNIPPLDDVLINTISLWKRNISAELNNEVSNGNLSALFNAIIFLRALEDNKKRYSTLEKDVNVLISACTSYPGSENFTGVLVAAQEILEQINIPEYLLDFNQLTVFNSLSKNTIVYLFQDFYRNRATDFYKYDFSIMSKHALSRIYERYVAILRLEETNQLALFPQLPEEDINKAYGAIYTPEYVARFFARYLKQNLTPTAFGNMSIAEPAVGSGIFLRTLLEIKCDPKIDDNSISKIKEQFQNLIGIDIDENACQAVKLSLALLQLVLTNEFPSDLNIKNDDGIHYFTVNGQHKGTFDSVISNPPFIATELLTNQFKERIVEYLGPLNQGRPDSYLAFLKVGIDLLKPGGYGCFVLPHSFLIAETAGKIRSFLKDSCWIRSLADLSAIQVFGNTGVYVILIIFQKKIETIAAAPRATIIKCRDFVGRALQDAIQNNLTENKFYSVFEIDQTFFDANSWSILPNKEIQLSKKLELFSSLKNFLEVRQGFVTGADDVFILDKKMVPNGEAGYLRSLFTR